MQSTVNMLSLNITQKLLRVFENQKILLSSLFHCEDPEGSQAKPSDVPKCQSREKPNTSQTQKEKVKALRIKESPQLYIPTKVRLIAQPQTLVSPG